MREQLLALAGELEEYEGDTCEGCAAYEQPECRGYLPCTEIVAKYCARKTREAVERDGENATTVSAYDLLPDDDRKALAWVREHGGLGAVKASVHQGAMEHGCLLKIAEMLGTSIYDGSDNADALLEKLSERLMPEGAEWPTVDGKPVDFVTGYEPSLGVLEAVSIYSNGACEVMGHDGIIKSVSEIHAIVDAADGKPLEVGQTVYAKNYGYVKCTVLAIEWVVDGYLVEVENEGGHKFRQTPDEFIHQRPVLDADGVPIREGDTLWRVNGDGPFTVIEYKKAWMRVKSEDGHVVGYWPDDLTHAKPDLDTWERIEEDARGLDSGVDIDLFSHTHEDLVRRCRALAERGE